jgi:metal-responsive CopG/Arc/MetJ family transcriptional regulator
MADEKQAVHMLLDRSLLKRLDDFRFKNRFDSRTEAIRWLLEWALKQGPKVERGE